jgi:hypothetical protein
MILPQQFVLFIFLRKNELDKHYANQNRNDPGKVGALIASQKCGLSHSNDLIGELTELYSHPLCSGIGYLKVIRHTAWNMRHILKASQLNRHRCRIGRSEQGIEM